MSQQPPPYGQNPYQPQPPPHGGYGGGPGVPWGPPPDHPQSTTVLVLGILGLVLCQVLAPFAWVMGNRVKGEIEAAPGHYGGLQQVNVGRILGIVGTALLGLWILVFLAYIVILIVAFSTAASA